MCCIVFNKFQQNEDIRKKLLAIDNIPLYECTRNRWWRSDYRLDSPEWATAKCPGLNKMGCILMDVQAALKKRACKTDALSKSPGVIIRSVQKMDRDIMKDVVNSQPSAEDKSADMEVDLPIIREEAKLSDKATDPPVKEPVDGSVSP